MPDERGRLAELLDSAGLPATSVVWAPEPAPGAAAPPDGPWVLVPYGQQTVVGAVGRRTFATYEALWTAEDAVDLAVRLAASPLPVRTASLADDEVAAGQATASAIIARTEGRGGQAGPTAVGPGDVLDVIGPETGHHLYALGTPFPHRSQPPSDVGAPWLTFEVVKHLPPTVLEGRVAPWFEQPGGGAMVVLDRPVRWYVDNGFLAAHRSPEPETSAPTRGS